MDALPVETVKFQFRRGAVSNGRGPQAAFQGQDHPVVDRSSAHFRGVGFQKIQVNITPPVRQRRRPLEQKAQGRGFGELGRYGADEQSVGRFGQGQTQGKVGVRSQRDADFGLFGSGLGRRAATKGLPAGFGLRPEAARAG